VEKTGAFLRPPADSAGRRRAKLGSKHTAEGPLAAHYVHSAPATVLCRPDLVSLRSTSQTGRHSVAVRGIWWILPAGRDIGRIFNAAVRRHTRAAVPRRIIAAVPRLIIAAVPRRVIPRCTETRHTRCTKTHHRRCPKAQCPTLPRARGDARNGQRVLRGCARVA
jgi:hypothetical protein